MPKSRQTITVQRLQAYFELIYQNPASNKEIICLFWPHPFMNFILHFFDSINKLLAQMSIIQFKLMQYFFLFCWPYDGLTISLLEESLDNSSDSIFIRDCSRESFLLLKCFFHIFFRTHRFTSQILHL